MSQTPYHLHLHPVAERKVSLDDTPFGNSRCPSLPSSLPYSRRSRCPSLPSPLPLSPLFPPPLTPLLIRPSV
jgi:hypothetical protein